MDLPEVVSRDTWLTARKELLRREKELTLARDALSADRRRLPMVRIEKDYGFVGSAGAVGLIDLFDGAQQLIVQHFMFDPAWDEGCPSCSAMASGMDEGVRDQLRRRNTAYAVVSRAAYPKLARMRQARGWTFDWYSSYGSDFNYDFHVTLDPAVAPAEYNYRSGDELVDAGYGWMIDHVGEQPGISLFLRDGDEVFHTYSTFGRGVEVMMPAFQLLDITPLGRQEDWEKPADRATTYPADPVLAHPAQVER